MALAGPDGQKAEALLSNTVAAGVRLLHAVAASAVARFLREGSRKTARRLFNEAERQALAAGFAAALATGELLGRARIRLRQQQAEARHAAGGVRNFSEDPTDFTAFADGISPMAPRRALEYFRSLVPTLSVPGERFVAAVGRQSFTVAGIVEESLLVRVKEVIDRRLESGEGSGTAPAEIQAVLDEAGLTPGNPQRAEMIFRTSTMDALTSGSTAEMQDPDVRETFPVFRFVGIRDGRQRPAHEVHFDRYYPSSMTFAEVRDSVRGDFDGYNCRCNFVPIDKWSWAALQAQGVRLAA